MEVKIDHLSLFHMRFMKGKGKLGTKTMGCGDVKYDNMLKCEQIIAAL